MKRVEWTEMYIRARERALTSNNIKSGWRGAGPWPLSPISVLEKANLHPNTTPLHPCTPTNSTPYDISLLDSSPPDGTELRHANAYVISELESSNMLTSPIKRYMKRALHAYEMSNTTQTTMRKELAEKDKLLRTRTKRTTGKRVRLDGTFLFSQEKVVEILREAEAHIAGRKAKKRRKSKHTPSEIQDDREDMYENELVQSDDDCIVVAMSG